MAVNPFLDGIVVMLTGMHVPRGSASRMHHEVEVPHAALVRSLDEFQEVVADITKSVSGTVSGKWGDAYAGAMATFGTGAGADYVKNLRDTSARIANYARETGYQIDYTNRMIIAQVVQFLVEWAMTLVLAVFNPVAALVEQSFLRALYQLILRSFLLRLLAQLAMFEALNVGLGAAMDVFVRWSLANEGKYTADGDQYVKQAVAFGAVQGAFMVFVPYAGSALAGLLAKGVGRDVVGTIEKLVGGAALPVGRDGAEDLGGTVAARDGGGQLGGFGRDLGETAAGMARRFEMGEAGPSAREAFRTTAADLFARDLGVVMGADAARALGQRWAEGFVSRFGKKDLAETLFQALDGLPQGPGGGLRRALSQGVADVLSTDWGRKFSGYTGDAIANTAHQNFSEGIYNLFTTGRFTTSWETGVAGAGAGVLGHLLTRNALSLGAGLREKLGLPPKPALSVDGPVNTVPGHGARLSDPAVPYRFAIRSGGAFSGTPAEGSGGADLPALARMDPAGPVLSVGGEPPATARFRDGTVPAETSGEVTGAFDPVNRAPGGGFGPDSGTEGAGAVGSGSDRAGVPGSTVPRPLPTSTGAPAPGAGPVHDPSAFVQRGEGIPTTAGRSDDGAGPAFDGDMSVGSGRSSGGAPDTAMVTRNERVAQFTAAQAQAGALVQAGQGSQQDRTSSGGQRLPEANVRRDEMARDARGVEAGHGRFTAGGDVPGRTGDEAVAAELDDGVVPGDLQVPTPLVTERSGPYASLSQGPTTGGEASMRPDTSLSGVGGERDLRSLSVPGTTYRAVERLGGQFRDQTLPRYNEIWARAEHDIATRLHHEHRHENTSLEHITTARQTPLQTVPPTHRDAIPDNTHQPPTTDDATARPDGDTDHASRGPVLPATDPARSGTAMAAADRPAGDAEPTADPSADGAVVRVTEAAGGPGGFGDVARHLAGQERTSAIDVALSVDYRPGHHAETTVTVASTTGRRLWRFSAADPETTLPRGFPPDSESRTVSLRDWLSDNPDSRFVSTSRDRQQRYGVSRYRYELGSEPGTTPVSVYDAARGATGVWDPASGGLRWEAGDRQAPAESSAPVHPSWHDSLMPGDAAADTAFDELVPAPLFTPALGPVWGSGQVRTDRWTPFGGRGREGEGLGPDAFVTARDESKTRPFITRPSGSGKRAEVGYDWTWHRRSTGEPGVLRVTRRLHLQPEDAVSAAELSSVRGAFARTLEQVVNRPGYRLPLLQPDLVTGSAATPGPRLSVAVEFTHDVEEAHGSVTVRDGLPPAERDMVQDEWFTGVHPAAYVHEFLHGLGVQDDVPAPQSLYSPDGPGNQEMSDGLSSVMGPMNGLSLSKDLFLTSEHLHQIHEVLLPYLHAGGRTGTERSASSAVAEAAVPNSGVDVAPSTQADREPTGLALTVRPGALSTVVSGLEEQLLAGGPGTRSLVLTAIPGTGGGLELYAVSLRDQVRWYDRRSGNEVPAPQGDETVVLRTLDLAADGSVLNPSAALRGLEKRAQKFPALALGADLWQALETVGIELGRPHTDATARPSSLWHQRMVTATTHLPNEAERPAGDTTAAPDASGKNRVLTRQGIEHAAVRARQSALQRLRAFAGERAPENEQWCVVVAEALRDELFPAAHGVPGAMGAGAARTADDAGGSGSTDRTAQHLAPGAAWTPVGDWEAVEAALVEEGMGPGSMALVMVRTPLGSASSGGRLRPGRQGHVWVGYYPRYEQDDAGPVWVEVVEDVRASAPHGSPSGVRLLDGHPASPLLQARAVIIGPTGRVASEALVPFRASSSTAHALVDPSTNPTYASPTGQSGFTGRGDRVADWFQATGLGMTKIRSQGLRQIDAAVRALQRDRHDDTTRRQLLVELAVWRGSKDDRSPLWGVVEALRSQISDELWEAASPKDLRLIRYSEAAEAFDVRLGQYLMGRPQATEAVRHMVRALWNFLERNNPTEMTQLGIDPTDTIPASGNVLNDVKVLQEVVREGNLRELSAMLFGAVSDAVLRDHVHVDGYSDWPWLQKERLHRVRAEASLRHVPLSGIYPPISQREFDVAGVQSEGKWFVAWTFAKDNVSMQLKSDLHLNGDHTGGLVTSGSSGSMLLILETMYQFQNYTGYRFNFPEVILGLTGSILAGGHHTVHEILKSVALWERAAQFGFTYVDGWSRYRHIPYLSEAELRSVAVDGLFPDEIALGLVPPLPEDDVPASAYDLLKALRVPTAAWSSQLARDPQGLALAPYRPPHSGLPATRIEVWALYWSAQQGYLAALDEEVRLRREANQSTPAFASWGKARAAVRDRTTELGTAVRTVREMGHDPRELNARLTHVAAAGARQHAAASVTRGARDDMAELGRRLGNLTVREGSQPSTSSGPARRHRPGDAAWSSHPVVQMALTQNTHVRGLHQDILRGRLRQLQATDPEYIRLQAVLASYDSPAPSNGVAPSVGTKSGRVAGPSRPVESATLRALLADLNSFGAHRMDGDPSWNTWRELLTESGVNPATDSSGIRGLRNFFTRRSDTPTVDTPNVGSPVQPGAFGPPSGIKVSNITDRDIPKILARPIVNQGDRVIGVSLHDNDDWSMREGHWASYDPRQQVYASYPRMQLVPRSLPLPWSGSEAFYVTMHGEYDLVKAYRKSGGSFKKTILDSSGLARIIMANPHYSRMRRDVRDPHVVLVICESGLSREHSMAQQLANILGVTVHAPNGKITMSPSRILEATVLTVYYSGEEAVTFFTFHPGGGVNRNGVGDARSATRNMTIGGPVSVPPPMSSGERTDMGYDVGDPARLREISPFASGHQFAQTTAAPELARMAGAARMWPRDVKRTVKSLEQRLAAAGSGARSLVVEQHVPEGRMPRIFEVIHNRGKSTWYASEQRTQTQPPSDGSFVSLDVTSMGQILSDAPATEPPVVFRSLALGNPLSPAVPALLGWTNRSLVVGPRS
ncbi:hypothetical protein OKJ48_04685 [Streptomyces kunmingensis]|uniref:OTU domain-containing protein n=1 Tax=Streptomyces kunmingensis TaxID=68225 RepID=A0ABU6C5U1_9ACTN|nr:hypothetical protein [Streptomyces kunmingensis]MEB3959552.1 hypothetical protein [Streptomyces kunmingensis]